MKKNLILLLFTICNLSCLFSQTKIDLKNSQVKKITSGKWYQIPDENNLKFTKKKRDSSAVWVFNKDGSLSIENTQHVKKSSYRWTIKNGKLYTPKWPKLDDFCSMYEFITLTDKELEYKRIGYKNINLPELCGNGDIEYPWEDAKFGDSDSALIVFFANNFIFKEYEKQQSFSMNFKIEINCEGEICNIRPKDYLQSNELDFVKAVMETFSKMPKWNPAKTKTLTSWRTTNSRQEYNCKIENGEFTLKKLKI